MAHPEDLVKLSQGPKVWNAWRQEDPDHIPDLRDAELTMSQRQFGPGNGGPIDLSDADLQGMVLRNSTLTDASLVRANIVATDLVQARLDGADLTGADLTDAVLDYSDLTGANLNGAILVGASLVNVSGLTQDQIAQAHGDASTALPAYLLPPESWFPALEGDLFNDYDSRFDLSPLYNDPYEVLGVERNATFDEIRAAFRTLVKKLHPDLNPDDAVAQERFKRVSIAYRILGDPVKRDRFNRGEIDTNGDVCPEFEAKKEFRRYAFRFYFAAAASLLLAAGILGGVWYTFWMQSDNVSTRTAEAGPPKLIERLTARKVETEPEQGVAAVTIDEPAVPSTHIAAVTNAIKASENLTDGNVHRNAAAAQSAEEAVQDGAASAESLEANAPDNAGNALATDTPVSIQTAADETGSGSGADNAASNNVGAASAEQVAASRTIVVEAPASPTPPFRTTASELDAVRPALGDGKSSEAGQQKFARATPPEA
ncbi:MAG TPA: DnaJ domain-containing protein, partial [Hyphomicrobiales bacterium]|nr:DnaJ domain-containing protein [Hyphomicrobiales bacterium]